MVKILPILIGIVGSYVVALLMGEVNFGAINQADWFGLAIHTGSMAKFSVSACITIAPIALATMMGHIGDIAAISATCEKHSSGRLPGSAPHPAGRRPFPPHACRLVYGGPANTRREHRCAGSDKGIRPARDAHCGLLRHPAQLFPKIRRAIQTVPGYHRRHFVCPVRHDIFRRRAPILSGKPGGFHQIPQPHHCCRYSGLCAWLQQRGRHP